MKQAIALLTICCQIATARALEPPSYAYGCDTPAGHFANWQRTVSGTDITITGKLRVVELTEHRKWNPVASVLLRGAGEKSKPFGFRLYVARESTDQFTLELFKVGGRDPIGTGWIPRTKTPIPFSLHLDAAGTLKVRVAELEGVTSVGAFKPATFELTCSTGEFDFTDTTLVEK